MPTDRGKSRPRRADNRTTVEISRAGSGRPHIDVTRRIETARDVVWDVFTDTRRWPEWGPSVRAVESSDTVIETGTTGRIQTIGGVWVSFRITACEDDRWTWRVARIPATGHRVVALQENVCRAVFEVPLLAAGYVPVCRQALSTIASLTTATDDSSPE